MPSLREDILHECFGPYEGIFKGGDEANNKLDLEIMQHVPHLRKKAATSLGLIVMQYDVDGIVSVPYGADWLGEDIAEEQGLTHIQLRKTHGDTEMDYLDYLMRIRGLRSKRLAIVDDCFTKFTNTRLALQVKGVSDRAVVAAAVWDRGLIFDRKALGIPVRALLTEHIPAQLPADSPLWEYAKKN